jgi:Domain of unknown function (DUF5666)
MISPALLTARRTLIVGGVVLAVGLTLAACSGSSASSSPSSPAPAGGGDGAAAGGGARPGAAGQVAAISGTTMQVQSQQAGQVAVTWTSSTSFSHGVEMTLSAVKSGDCVIATAPSEPSGPSFTATAVSISSPVNGQCGGGQRPSGQRPSGFPSGGPGGGQGRAAFANGTVSSVSGSTIVIAARQPGSNGATTDRSVTVDGSTKLTTQQATTASSLKVGLCVAAQGSADSTGAVTATSVRMSDPVNGQCQQGFGQGGNNG